MKNNSEINPRLGVVGWAGRSRRCNDAGIKTDILFPYDVKTAKLSQKTENSYR